MKIGILGAGRIAATLAETMNRMPEVECYGVASRDLEKAKIFAKDHKFQHAFGSYEDMLADQEVELIYIATPHSHHYQHIKMCLDAGKHVLCEKSFTVNEKQAAEVLRIAKEKNLLLTEAIWTRYMPSRKMIDDLLAEKVVGNVMKMTANLNYPLLDKDVAHAHRETGTCRRRTFGCGNLSIKFCLYAFWGWCKGNVFRCPDDKRRSGWRKRDDSSLRGWKNGSFKFRDSWKV